jgi:hypothetical protein
VPRNVTPLPPPPEADESKRMKGSHRPISPTSTSPKGTHGIFPILPDESYSLQFWRACAGEEALLLRSTKCYVL